MTRPIKICLFDIDGTLILSGRAGQDAVLATLWDLFGVKAEWDSVEFAGRTDRAIMSDLFQLNGIPWTSENWVRFQQAYLRHLPCSLRQRAGRVLPGVRELLDQFREGSHAEAGLLTGNVQAGAREKLRHFQLEEHFAFGGFGDEHELRDDVAREALRDARQHLQRPIDPTDVWVIGDTPSDVRCGRAIGACAGGRHRQLFTGSIGRSGTRSAAGRSLRH